MSRRGVSAFARVACAVVALGALPACGRSQAAAREAPAALASAAPIVQPLVARIDPAAAARLGIRVEAAGSAAPHHRLELPATLEVAPERSAEVGTLVAGRVTAVHAQIGQAVKKGQRLATMLVPSLARAQADHATAVAADVAARANLAREQRLVDEGLGTVRELELAKERAAASAAELAAAGALLRSMGLTPSANADAAAYAGRIELVAPIAGTVVRRDVVLGKWLSPEDRAFAIGDASELLAMLDVPEADLPYVAEGQAVELSLDAAPGRTFTSSIALLEPQLDGSSRTVRARVPVANADGALRAGMFARAAITMSAPVDARALRVPSDAIQPVGDADAVFVERGEGLFEVRTIRIARRTAQIVEVAEGLSAGERIVVAGAFVVRAEVTRQ